MKQIHATDLFWGAVGSSRGARPAGVNVRAAFDRSLAADVYKANFPGTLFFSEPVKLSGGIGQVDRIIGIGTGGSYGISQAASNCSRHSIEFI